MMCAAPRPAGRHLVLVGPTASGKSSLALALARRRLDAGEPVELVSMDSMAVYRGMDIGTTSPSAADRAAVRHHLIDVVDPDEEFSVAAFTRAVVAALDEIESRDARAILVGGTGLYVQAVVDGLEVPGRYPEVADRLAAETDTRVLHERLVRLDPVAASRLEPDNRRRILRALEVTEGSGRPFSSYGPGLDAYPETPFVLGGLRVDRELLTARIRARVDQQLRDGFLDEVRALLRRPAGVSRTAGQALGYGELAAHLRGECTLDEAVATIVLRTRQFAVRQIRWFRRDPRIEWFDHSGDPLDTLDSLDAHWRASEQRTDA
jgi:tRNA dimethylallyltransferase